MRHILLAISAVLVATVASAHAAVDVTANQIGALTSIGNADTRVFYQYDAQGRIVATQNVQDGQSRTIATTYGYPQNPASTTGAGIAVVREAFPDGEEVSYSYDATGMIIGLRTTSSGVTDDILRDHRVNARGQAVRVELGNGTVTTYAYDEGGHQALTRTLTVNAAGQTIQDYGYSWDEHDNVTGTTDGVVPSQAFTFEYDSLDQLTAAISPTETEHYIYDAVGNLTRKGGLVQTYNAGGRPHALASSGGAAYNYDENGNVTSAGAITLAWNAENMAVRVAAGSLVSNNSFLGEARWKKSEKGVTTYYVPGMRVENGVSRKYYGTYAERSDSDRQLRFYHPDHLGSSSVMTDRNGAVIHRAGYAPWGAERFVEGAFTPRLQFNFKEKDETGLYDYGARLYDPVTGRWLSPDTDLTDGLNRYAYVRNNPWSLTDPTGHQSDVPCSGRPDDTNPACFEGPAVQIDADPTLPLTKAAQSYEPGYEVDPFSFQGQMGMKYVQGVKETRLYHGSEARFGYTGIRIRDDGTVLGVYDGCQGCATGAVNMIRDPWNPLGTPIPILPSPGPILRAGAQRVLFGSATGRVFWTQGSREGAEALATQIGGHTLNSTLAGRTLMYADKFVDWKYMQYGWGITSKYFARGAQGTAHFTFKDGAAPFGFFFLKKEVTNMRNVTTLVPVKVP